MSKFLDKIFGKLKITWPVVIIMAIALGIWTALVAMFVPVGNSFHDIAVTAEWWMLPAVLIIFYSKKPLEAALKVFIFFLISQPLVYLVQVPFNDLGWKLFLFYPYWFKITLATFPAAFLGWYIKKDKWYSGLILSGATIFLGVTAIGFIGGLKEAFPNHLITIIYCISMIPLLIFGALKKTAPRVIAFTLTAIALIVCVILDNRPVSDFAAYGNSFISENGVTLVGTPTIITTTATKSCHEPECVKITDEPDGTYTFMLSGKEGGEYSFTIEDEAKNSYSFKYWFDPDEKTVKVELEK